MLDLVGAIVGMMAVAVNLVALTSVLPGSLVRRRSVAAIAGGWVGLASGLGAAGIGRASQRTVPVFGRLRRHHYRRVRNSARIERGSHGIIAAQLGARRAASSCARTLADRGSGSLLPVDP